MCAVALSCHSEASGLRYNGTIGQWDNQGATVGYKVTSPSPTRTLGSVLLLRLATVLFLFSLFRIFLMFLLIGGTYSMIKLLILHGWCALVRAMCALRTCFP